MKLNKMGIELIKHFEGCRLTTYKDLKGILTIGWGTTGEEAKEGRTITQEEADKMLYDRLEKEFVPGVTSCVRPSLTDNQFSALVCFAYNLGVRSLKTSTLLKRVNEKDDDKVGKEFLRWDRADGKEVQGLLNRREAEAALYATPDEVTS